MKLPKNLILKYGISKKAWQVFKQNKTTSRSVNTMAKKKGNFKKQGSGVTQPLMLTAAGFGYGMIRSWLSEKISPITAKVPFGQYADNVILGVGGYYLGKKFGGKYGKTLGTVMLITEAVLAGAETKGFTASGSSGSGLNANVG